HHAVVLTHHAVVLTHHAVVLTHHAVVLTHHAVVLTHHARDLAACAAARLPRSTAIARQAVRVGRLDLTGNRAAIAVRNTAVAALSEAGPALFLRGCDGIADWRPPYASEQAPLGKRW
ncbi:hypothetical protein ABT245_15500, partial [Streptomyces sp. NPDC001508]